MFSVSSKLLYYGKDIDIYIDISFCQHLIMSLIPAMCHLGPSFELYITVYMEIQ